MFEKGADSPNTLAVDLSVRSPHPFVLSIRPNALRSGNKSSWASMDPNHRSRSPRQRGTGIVGSWTMRATSMSFPSRHGFRRLIRDRFQQVTAVQTITVPWSDNYPYQVRPSVPLSSRDPNTDPPKETYST